MRPARFAVPAAALSLFVACSDPTATDALIDDSAVTLDVAATAGEAVASMLGTMSENETYAGASANLTASAAGPATSSLNVSRTRSCYDAAGAAVSNCLPFSSVRMIVVAASIDGTRSATRTRAEGGSVDWTGAIHRVMSDTTRRIFTNTTETSRVHAHVAVGNDTTTFTDATHTRRIAEAVRDSVRSLTFNLPRSANPYPVSGSIVRNVTANVLVTTGDRTATATRSHRVEVVFPADAQGNVALKINAKTCQLNLVTRAVTNCQ